MSCPSMAGSDGWARTLRVQQVHAELATLPLHLRLALASYYLLRGCCRSVPHRLPSFQAQALFGDSESLRGSFLRPAHQAQPLRMYPPRFGQRTQESGKCKRLVAKSEAVCREPLSMHVRAARQKCKCSSGKTDSCSILILHCNLCRTQEKSARDTSDAADKATDCAGSDRCVCPIMFCIPGTCVAFNVDARGSHAV